MYDEFDNKENEDRYDPKQPSAEDEVKTGQMYGEEDQLSENEEVQASTAEETEASAESREKTDGMTAFTKIIRSRNIRWKAAGKSRLAQARRSQLLSDVQPYSVWCLV